MSPSFDDTAHSVTIGVLLAVVITILLAACVLLMAPRLPDPGYDPTVPAIFEITRIQYSVASDGITYVGLVVVLNTGTMNYRNRNLRVNTYINGNPADCRIPTLNNNWFCQLDHTGVTRLYGVGTWGNKDSPTSVWPAHSEISIEYKKGRLHPGDRVTLEFIDTGNGEILSRDTYPHTEKRADALMKLYLSHLGA